MKPENMDDMDPEKRNLKRVKLLIIAVLFGLLSGTETPPHGDEKMHEIVALIVALICSLLVTRKPRFEVPEEHTGLSNVNWFNLKKDSEVEVRVKQLYFAVGTDFLNAGWQIPTNAEEKLLCLVIADSQIETESAAKGVQSWFVSLVTQSVAGDLYREALKCQANKQMKWCPKGELMAAPREDVELGDFFDVLVPAGAFNPRFVISHEQHPTNPSRSLYKLKEFNA